MSLNFFDKLSQNFIELLNDKDDYNVIIDVENKEKSFTAHSNILKYRSPYFRKELENIQPNENNIKTIIKSSVPVQIFDIILKYIYGGVVNLENVETRFIFDLMLAANEFELDELSVKLETLLVETKASWLKSYFSIIYRAIFNKNNFKKLENFCNDIIAKHPNLIFENSDFTSLPEFAVPDRSVKSNILPARSELVTELPPCAEESKEPFSTIISKEHAAEIFSWIDRKTTTYSTIDVPYEFELILSGTRDGFAPQTFWNICHGHAKTVVVVKVKGTDEILGGYNPLTWDNPYNSEYGKWMKTKDSFIFSLKNGNIQNTILSRVKKPENAIWITSKSYRNNAGPNFGDFRLYSDLSNFNLDNANYCNDEVSDYYEKPIRISSDRFSIANYEVFKVIRKKA
ncbi:hypothetical protein Glove_219g61 [Diversispora epigaea]|uniref:BTB domain-containing protein n=1 Tax=Diversispora epigaea TaxID=1348612 RepID=A0A397IFW2_9GLOM|nr:hypothetical protein Glove_219g61 [Diversispora epigaea]